MAEIIKYLDETQGKYLVQKILAEIPTALSELTNDQNFIDNTVDNLSNYYSKQEVDTKIGDLATIEISIVDALPATGKSNVIYLVPKAEGAETGNLKDEYLWNAQDSVFEKIGDTAIDLSGYLTTEVAAQVYATKAELATEQGRIATLEGKVQSLEEGTYDDSEVRELIQANADAIDAIEGDYLKAADKTELQEQIDANESAIQLLTNGVDSEAIDGVNDLIAYVNEHGAEVTGMKNDISANATAIEGKADKATTLAGYGITDAYTKGEVDTLVADHIKLGDISAETTGDGNVVTAVAYDAATGKITVTKDMTVQAITQAEIDAWF